MRPIKLSKKQSGLAVISMALALASLRPSDGWVFGPMLLISWGASLYVVYHHEGRWTKKVGPALIITLIIGFIAYRNTSFLASRQLFRRRLGEFLSEGAQIKENCLLTRPPIRFSCKDDATDWVGRVHRYLQVSSDDPTYAARFDATEIYPARWIGVSVENNAKVDWVIPKLEVLKEFIKEDTPNL